MGRGKAFTAIINILLKAYIKEQYISIAEFVLTTRLLCVTKATAPGGRKRELEEAQQNRANIAPQANICDNFASRADKAKEMAAIKTEYRNNGV